MLLFPAVCVTLSLRAALTTEAFSMKSRIEMFSTQSGLNAKKELKPLPSRKPGPFRNIRDSISYLKDPDGFIKTRVSELGPVFQTHVFFRPTVIIGGREAVAEFIKKEVTGGSVQNSTLPEIFEELHTEWGTLNMPATSTRFQQARKMLLQVLSSPSAFEAYDPIMETNLDDYMTNLVSRVKENESNPIYIVKELKSSFLQLFSTLFTGKGLSKEQEQMFDDYNSGLLSLSRNMQSYKKGRVALDQLLDDFLARYKDYTNNLNHEPNYVCDTFKKLQDDDPSGWPDERIATAMVLIVWGAYIEVAALGSNMLVCMMQQSAERKALMMATIREDGNENKQQFISGVIRESLRLRPPGSGGFRLSGTDFDIAGYRIPANMVVCADPRIGNLDESMYPESSSFFPERWMDVAPKSSNCPVAGTARGLGLGSWLPGGIGAHQCPGMGLAEAAVGKFIYKFCCKIAEWKCAGDGLDKNGNIKQVLIPIKMPVDEFSLSVTLL